MSYFAESAWNYLAEKIQRLQLEGANSRRVLVVIPSLPESATLAMAETFTSRCMADGNVTITNKIAQVVFAEWSEAGIAKARQHGWTDDRGNLTYYRNCPVTPGRTNLVVLFGADRITDVGGLEDFHRCDLDTVWKEAMRCSFKSWVKEKVGTIGLDNIDDKELRECDRLLVPLLEHGKGDLLTIADWLAHLDLHAAASSHDAMGSAMRIMLRNLRGFGLPRFTGFSLSKKRATLSPYIEKATAFFSYTVFLEPKEREKAAKAISALNDALASGEDIGVEIDGPDVTGPYADIAALLGGLQNYILTEDREDCERIKQCDFVTIVDKILKFRKKISRPRPDTLHKLSGGPVEVVLHAVWQTFREFGRERTLSDAKVQGVEIVSDRFKHDYESVDDGDAIDSTADRNELARAYLRRLLGGVDSLVTDRMEVQGSDRENLLVTCRLLDDGIPCVYARTAEPQLEFSVRLSHDGGGGSYRRRFAWRLPEIQAYRLAESLLQWAGTALRANPDLWKVPVFHLPYYEELLRASDDEETRRIMQHCIRDARPDDPVMTNLIGPEWLVSKDILLEPIKLLAERYSSFLVCAHKSGLHAALFSDVWGDLRQAYTAACRIVMQDPRGSESQMAAMLLRAFLLVHRRDSHLGAAWGTEPFERSGVATVLHPALLEMLEGQVVFLFSCFNAAFATEAYREDRRKAFAENVWTGYVDLASIHAPLVGLLHNEDQNLDTNVRGVDLIHRIGSPEHRDAALSTRLLLRYDNGGDEEQVADTEMFRESRESKLLYRLIADYFRLHPHARDGLQLAVFRNQDIQPIIAAVHQYLNRLADPSDRRYYVLPPDRTKPYAISVTVFTESGDDVDVTRWIEQWQERWEAAETEEKFQAYRRCRFSVSHRIVEAGQLGAFRRLIADSFETDIAVLYDFIGAGKSGNRFAEVTPFDVTTRTLKFPILEKSCCSVRHPTDSLKRSRVISNRQFAIGTLHAEVMLRLKNQGVQAGKEFVILGTGDFAPWRGVVDALHAKAEWVICIDPNMDERLIKANEGSKANEREIIGFGSGVGSHGEANYTVSTEQFTLADVHVRLSASIAEVYGGCGWSVDDYRSVAEGVLQQAKELSGLSLVRATGVGHYIRDFMAYSLSRKMLREKRKVLCDHLVSLDAYRHWFDLADDERRPDLMWLTAWLGADGRVCVTLRLIECKVAERSDEHLLKARAQINNGLRVLIPAFAPRTHDGATQTEDGRPDQRYWWLQLHRLVASKAEVDSGEQAAVLSALERLAEGDYAIEWGASVFAFWSDDPSDVVRRIGSWKPNADNELVADVYAIGAEFVRRLATDRSLVSLTWAEWYNRAQETEVNVCDGLEDIELPPGEDDDEDMPAWDDQPDIGSDGEVSEDDDTSEGHSDESDTPIPLQIARDTTPPSDGTGHATPGEDPREAPRADVADDKSCTGAAPIPNRILLGKTVNGSRPVYWEFGNPELANRHMLVFGTSGMGKTYAIQCVLCELGHWQQNSLIIDYTDGFIPSKLEAATAAVLRPEQHFIQHAPLPINPFKAQESQEAGLTFRDTPITIGRRIAAIFTSVYQLGNQQFPVLIDAIAEGVGRNGDDFTMAQLLEVLQGYIDDGIHGNTTVRTALSKIRPFIQSNPFADDDKGIGWLDLFTDSRCRCHVFQFFRVDRYTARALIEFVLWDLYAFVSSCGNKNLPRVVVLDEVQNLDLGPDGPVAKYLTEGRKHGIALITATQTVRGVGGVSDPTVSRLFQAEHKLFFKPTENEMREHAQLLHNAISSVSVPEWGSRLASLQIGECWSLGRSLNDATGKLVFQAQRIKITPLAERGFNA